MRSCGDSGCSDERTMSYDIKDDYDNPKPVKAIPAFKLKDYIEQQIEEGLVVKRMTTRSQIMYVVYMQYYKIRNSKPMTFDGLYEMFSQVVEENEKVDKTDLWKEVNYLVMSKVLTPKSESGEDVYAITPTLIEGVEHNLMQEYKNRKEKKEPAKGEKVTVGGKEYVQR